MAPRLLLAAMLVTLLLCAHLAYLPVLGRLAAAVADAPASVGHARHTPSAHGDALAAAPVVAPETGAAGLGAGDSPVCCTAPVFTAPPRVALLAAVLQAGGAAAATGADVLVGRPPRAGLGDPQRRRALLQVFLN
jgi:hypothetical protein